MKYRLFFVFVMAFLSLSLKSQDLEAILNDQLDIEQTEEKVEAIFKSVRLISGQSVKNPDKSDLVFLISHRFGELTQGASEFFGLDISTIRLGFEYGLTNRIALGIGRSSYNKVVDNYIKIKVLEQNQGDNKIPVSVSLVLISATKTKKWDNPELDYLFSHRLSYTSQIMIARKFNSKLSLQLSPGYLHRNLVRFAEDPNDIFYTGIGGRYKISKRVSINAEYFYSFSERIRNTGNHPLSLGVDIETGGHVFQLMLSNSRGMTETALIPDTMGSWTKGDILFGFNITRTF